MKKMTIRDLSALPKPFTNRALPFMLGGAAGALVIAAASISLVMLITHSYFFGSPTVIE